MKVRSFSVLAGSGLTAGLLLLSPSGCSRQYLSVAETDVVATFEDEDRDYSKYKTYVLPDKVTDLCAPEDADSGDGDDEAAGGLGGFVGIDPDRCEEADHAQDQTLLQAIRSEMDALGYREVAASGAEKADLAFLVGVVAQDNWFVESSGYCYPYYYYYGCWYPTYTYAYNLPTNAYVIDLTDVSESEASDELKLSSAWTVFIKGLAEQSSEKTGKQRVQDAVKQAFKQSSYLAEGGE